MVNWSDAQITGFFNEYRWLSNFWPSEIELDGVKYPSVEHAYQASKTLDLGQREAIRVLDNPGKAKRAGKTVTMRHDWDRVKIDIMKSLVTQKFTLPELRAKLLATGTKTLVEGNPWRDKFWGAAWDHDHKVLYGENWLGRILMGIRDNIRSSTPSEKGWRIRRSEKVEDKNSFASVLVNFSKKSVDINKDIQTFITFWRREDSTWAMQAIDATCYETLDTAEADAVFLATKYPHSNIDIAEW